MSFFVGYWILQGFSTMMLLIGLESWDARHNPEYTGLSVANIMLGAFFVLCPIMNSAVALVCFLYFCSDIAPKIVFFKGNQNAK